VKNGFGAEKICVRDFGIETRITAWVELELASILNFLCENLCEKNFPKPAKIGKNRKNPGKSYLTISVAYNNLRRLGNPEVITVNHWVRGSNPCWGAN
jgi:hypothetical protein